MTTAGCACTGISSNPTESSFFSPDNKFVAVGVSQSNGTPRMTEVQLYSVDTATATFTSLVPVLTFPVLAVTTNNVTFESVTFSPTPSSPSEGCFAYSISEGNGTTPGPVVTLTYDGSVPSLTNPNSSSPVVFQVPEQQNYSPDGQLLGITDQGNSATTRAVYLFKRTFTFSAAATPVTCFGGSNGSISVTGVTGGTPTYTYSLNNGTYGPNNTFSNLPAGNYTVSVMDADTCITTESPIIVSQPSFAATVSPAIVVVCTNQTLQFTATPMGGTAPYTYIWTTPTGPIDTGNNPTLSIPNPTSANNGNYFVTVTDSLGCQITSSTPSEVVVIDCTNCPCTSSPINNLKAR